MCQTAPQLLSAGRLLASSVTDARLAPPPPEAAVDVLALTAGPALVVWSGGVCAHCAPPLPACGGGAGLWAPFRLLRRLTARPRGRAAPRGGAGKSTFIEALGMEWIKLGFKVAVVAVTGPPQYIFAHCEL